MLPCSGGSRYRQTSQWGDLLAAGLRLSALVTKWDERPLKGGWSQGFGRGFPCPR